MGASAYPRARLPPAARGVPHGNIICAPHRHTGTGISDGGAGKWIRTGSTPPLWYPAHSLFPPRHGHHVIHRSAPHFSAHPTNLRRRCGRPASVSSIRLFLAFFGPAAECNTEPWAVNPVRVAVKVKANATIGGELQRSLIQLF